MNQPQLPAHLQGRQSRHLAETAAQGLGGALPPHISIRGNAFTLVDATGAEQPVQFQGPDGRLYNQPYLDICIVDLSDVMCKQYYGGKDWTPDSNDPPVCWSANGVGPSRESSQPQCRTCAECPHNVRGSATSRISGVAIKACRDEKWLCVTLPGFGKDMLFQLKVTPGSFQNWKGYMEQFKGTPVDLDGVITRVEFQQGVNGVLLFAISPLGYTDPATTALIDRVLAAKTSDIFVGRNDRPIQMLAAPAPQSQTHAPLPNQAQFVPLAPATTAVPQSMPQQGFVPQPGPAVLAASSQPGGFSLPFGSPSLPTTNNPGGFSVPGQSAPAEQAQPARRRRRTQAEIAAAGQQQPAQPQANPSVAPFPHPGAAQPVSHPQPIAQPPANPAPFGVGQAPAPNADLAAMLNSTFGPPGGPPR